MSDTAAVAARMYPSMAPPPPPAPAEAKPVSAPADLPRRSIDVGVSTMYPNSPELVPPAGASAETPKAEGQPDAPIASADDPGAQAAPTPLTQDAIDAAVPATIAAQRAQESRPYVASVTEAFGGGKEHVLVNTELAHMSLDVGLDPGEVRGLVYLARQFTGKTIDPKLAETWNGLTTDAEKAAAAQFLQSDPRKLAVLKAAGIDQTPQVIRYLARAAQMRR